MSDLKVALITAGGSGMGADCARALAQDGFKVGILSSSGKGVRRISSTAGCLKMVSSSGSACSSSSSRRQRFSGVS